MNLPNLPADRRITDGRGNSTDGWYLYLSRIGQVLRDAVFGGQSLTTIGAVPKVTAAGVLGESSITDNAVTVTITEPVWQTGALPAFGMTATGSTVKARMGTLIVGGVTYTYVSHNLYWDGSHWMCDDTSKIGSLIIMRDAGVWDFNSCGPAANPQTVVAQVKIGAAGEIIANADISAATSFKIGATDVISATEPANTVLAGPTSGTAALPAFRPLVTADVFAASETANTVLAGPASGSPAAPTFRALTAADVPSINATQVNGASVPVSALLVGTNGAGQLIVKYATTIPLQYKDWSGANATTSVVIAIT